MTEVIRKINQEDITNFLKSNFEKIGNTPMFWLIYAETLKRSAEVLYKEYKKGFKSSNANTRWGAEYFQMVSFFLYGLAIENALKGLWISKDDTLISGGRINEKKLKTHNLLLIAERAGFVTNKQERKILMLLTKYTESLGRYPIPKNLSGYLTPNQARESKDLLEIKNVRSLFRKVKKRII